MSVEPARTSTSPAGFCAIRVGQRSDVGRVRSENQDFATVTTGAAGRVLLVVADGMGGHRGGATASRLAAEVLTQHLGPLDAQEPSTAIRAALLAANDEILRQSQQSIELRGMGTTCSAMVIIDCQGWIGHVGDSRVYRIRDGAAEQLTDDHSLVASMVREGLLSEHEAEVHPRRNVLQRSVGVAAEMEVDVTGPFEIRQGDAFLLCSDGLHGLVRPEEMASLVDGRSEQDAVEQLVELALERGAPDNVTVIVARAVAPEMATRNEETPTPAQAGRSSGWIGWILLIALLATALVGMALLGGRN